DGRPGYGGSRDGVAVDRTGGVAPVVAELGLSGGWEAIEPFAVLAGGDLADGLLDLAIGEELAVVAAGLDQGVDQGVAVGRDLADLIAGLAEGVEQVDDGGGSIEADGVADAGVLGGVI